MSSFRLPARLPARSAALVAALLVTFVAAMPASAAEPPGWSQEELAIPGTSRAHLPDVDLRRARDGRLIGIAERATADQSSIGITIFARTAGASGSWRLLAVTRHSDISPTLALSAGGAVHAAWVRQGYGIRYTTNRTGTWGVEVVKGGSGGESPSIALTNGGSPSVAFTVSMSRTSNALRIASKISTGWVYRTVATGDIGQPSLQIDQFSKRHIVWVKRTGTSPGLYYATDRSGTWRTTRLTSATDVAAPRLVLDLARNAHVAYERTGTTLSRVLYVTNASGAWKTTTASAPAGGSSPEIELGANERPVIVYTAAQSGGAGPAWIAEWTGTGWTRSAATEDVVARRSGLATDGAALHVLALRPFADPSGDGELIHTVRATP